MKFGLVSRTTMKWIAGASAAIAVISLASTAGAVPVLSTGVGILGDPETNWSLTASPGSTSLTIVSGPADYPANTWVVAPSGSNWITPYAGGGTTATSEAPLGEYDYSLTFADPGTSVSIDWSSDNGAKFFLNGNLLSTVNDTGYGGLTSFTINSFLASNTFEVQVQNVFCDGCNNPTGLLVSASFGGGAPTITPLPAALPLFASGLGALGLLGWRKKRKSA